MRIHSTSLLGQRVHTFTLHAPPDVQPENTFDTSPLRFVGYVHRWWRNQYRVCFRDRRCPSTASCQLPYHFFWYRRVWQVSVSRTHQTLPTGCLAELCCDVSEFTHHVLWCSHIVQRVSYAHVRTRHGCWFRHSNSSQLMDVAPLLHQYSRVTFQRTKKPACLLLLAASTNVPQPLTTEHATVTLPTPALVDTSAIF